jgi:transcriptional regulator with XRE-family HTH domain
MLVKHPASEIPSTAGPPFTIADEMPRKGYGQTTFGPRLVELRKSRGLTQVQLAELAGTTQRAISYYENDAGYPPAPALVDLARALEVSTDVLLGVKAPKIERYKEDSETRRLWKRFQRVTTLPDRDQKAVIRLINSLVAGSASRRNGSFGEHHER